MKFLTRILLYVVAIMTLRAPAARGQDRAADGTWGFVSVRYDTRSPASIYAGYGWHAAFAMGGMTHNPRTGHDELIGGVGAVFRTRTSEHWIAVATAGGDAASFPQVYWLPTVRMRALTARAQVKWSVTSGTRTAQKLSVSPLSMTFAVGRRMSAGLAADISAAERTRTRVGAGVEFRVRLPGASVGVDALRAVKGDASRLRVFFASLY